MTRVGQFLVMLLTALSVLFLGFALSAVSTMTDWQGKYDAELKKLKEQTEKRTKLQEKIDELTKATNNEVDQHKQQQLKFADKLKIEEKAYTEQFVTLTQAIGGLTKQTNRSKEALDEINILRKKATDLQEQIKTTKQEEDDAMKKRFALELERNELEGSNETISTRRDELERRSKKLSTMLDRSATSTDSKAKGQKIVENPASKK